MIEGVGKRPAIQKYLGNGYKVFATLGHVRDLPEKTLAVDVDNNFAPTYVIMPDKKKVVADLKKEAEKAESVILATDPDREGEAISWHIASILGIPENEPVRITFNEISKKAIDKALLSPRPIDKNLVDAQQARRVLDRLVGYKLSPVLAKKIQNRLSAGRVQSPTLKLVVDREREITGFKPEEYWPFGVILSARGSKIKANLAEKNGKKIKLTSAGEVDAVVKDLEGAGYFVADVVKAEAFQHAPAPFRTSTMQQEAISRLGMTLKSVSQTAQDLYEGVDIPGEGKVPLITYIRTDSTRVSPDAAAAARNFIAEKFGVEYVPAKPNVYASKGNVQDAHEAIRPINVLRAPESMEKVLQKNHFRLYKLIYDRFLASQMSQARFDTVNVDIEARDYLFKVNVKTLAFKGYTAVYGGYEEEKDEDEDGPKKIPEMKPGDELNFTGFKYEQKFTKPPQRFTEATLIKAMEEKGIGRPATYQPTVSLLSARGYVTKEKKSLVPTELGCNVSDLLLKYFPDVMNIAFTADMETKLDTIEEGGSGWQRIIENFYSGFEEELKAALGDDYKIRKDAVPTDYVCDKCGGNMVIREGKKGKFLACSNYPKCKNTMALDENGNAVKPKEAEVSDVKCDKCGALMVVKEGKYGKFLACPNYPKCKNTRPLEEENLPKCPSCGNSLRQIKSYKGTFYGCTNYPACKFMLFDKPTFENCPNCGSILVEKKRKDGLYYICSNRECDFSKKQ